MTEKITPKFGQETCYLTSDAQVSEKLSAEDVDSQPMKIWFGNKLTEDEDIDSEEPLDQPPPECAGGPPPPSDLVNTLVSNIRTGKGTTVAILDSGINTSHIAFSGRISQASETFVGGTIEDANGHGTQCAGLVCGAISSCNIDGRSYTIQGVAPLAKVLVCKVTKILPDGTYGADLNASIQALDYILWYNQTVSQEDRVSVISMSWGMLKYSYTLAMKLQEVICKDIVVVCAAGNDGVTRQQSIAYPARLGHILSIGSCNSGGRSSCFSPRGRELDFLAPGENLWAPTINSNEPTTVNGTSFAAPLVAGIVCQLLEDLKDLSNLYRDPHILKYFCNVWGMRELLKSMCTKPSGHDQDEGFGILDPMNLYFKKTPQEKYAVLYNIVA